MSQETVDQFFGELSGFATPLISDNLDRLRGAVGLKSYSAHPRLAGRAFTVKTRPGDNLFFHLSLDLAMPGEIIVVDAGGDLTNALAGEIMKSYAESRGIAGFVIDGAIRDVDCFEHGDLKCFARGISHRGPYKDGPGAVRCPVSIGGMVVHHGDYMIGDADGLVAIRPWEVEGLLSKVRASHKSEVKLLADIQAGCFNRAWLKPLIDEYSVVGTESVG